MRVSFGQSIPLHVLLLLMEPTSGRASCLEIGRERPIFDRGVLVVYQVERERERE